MVLVVVYVSLAEVCAQLISPGVISQLTEPTNHCLHKA